MTNVKDFQNKNRENFDKKTICIPGHAVKNKLPNWFACISGSEAWKKGTVLIVGDSVVSGFRESKMSSRKNIKVRFFPGARIQDMYYYLIPLLRKDQIRQFFMLVQTIHRTLRLMKCWKNLVN